MLKQGDIVTYVGIKSNRYGDTQFGERDGYLVPGHKYAILRIRDYNDVGDQELLTLSTPMGPWSLHKECVMAEPRHKKNLPDWF